MTDDEQAIHDLVKKWFSATKAGDLETVLGLMADDVVFMVAGQEPFGKAAFAASNAEMKGFQIEGSAEIQELQILGDWAWMRNRLRVSITPASGPAMVRSDCTLTILRKEPNGKWVILRDANLLTPEKSA